MRRMLLLGLALLAGACARSDAPAEARGERIVLVVHGGAGTLNPEEMKAEGFKREQFEEGLAAALFAGYDAMKRDGATSADGVVAAIRVMEDSPLFNAGHGAVLNEDGRAELDAAIMQGRMTGAPGEGKHDPRKRAGAVAGVWHIKNPIAAARAVMEMPDQKHVLLVGEGAEHFALSADNRKRFEIEEVGNSYFVIDRRLKQLRKALEEKAKPKGPFGTVGAVARKDGTLVSGTSTGGLTAKMRGRVGDSPLIGAGTYADDRACGVSCTGTGEVFIRHAVAHDVVARMLYRKDTLDTAVKSTLDELPDEDGGVGGLIALDVKGRHAFGMSPKCDGMYRGYLTEKGEVFVAIYRGDKMKQMKRR
jgi:L-asparaginase / beta-aspartyl-peptidase